MNEKAVFFFSSDGKKKKQHWDRMNEWTCELFQEKKKTEKTPKNAEKKKHNLLFNKIIETPPDFEWMANELFLGKKKKQVVFFFFPLRGKKKKRISGFWMNEWAMNFSAEKKKYGTFGSTNMVSKILDSARKSQGPLKITWSDFHLKKGGGT